MTTSDFDDLLSRIDALSPDQMQRLRRELEARLASAGPPHRPIWDEIEEITAGIPDEEFLKLPADGADQHDHYVYGTPKRAPSP
jgi:hypothetical protein